MLAMVKDGLCTQPVESLFLAVVWVACSVGGFRCCFLFVLVFFSFFKNRLNKCPCAIAVDISDYVVG